jgi:glycerol-3-phosphate dehydrogenase (NAD(P)+)
MNILVIGCGAWGTTIAKLLCKNNKEVFLACHDKAIIQDINTNQENSFYNLREPKLPLNIRAIHLNEISSIINQCDTIFIVTASKFFRSTIQSIIPLINNKKLIVSGVKGIEESGLSMLDIAKELFAPDFFKNNFCILSGPNLAKEIFVELPSTTVIACQNILNAKKIQEIITNDYFRVYISDDLIGVMYGGILKNIIAIGAGISDALELGTNAKSALLVRGIAEICRYCLKMGGKEDTVYGLSGFGDLITTCMGSKSRNYTVGYRIGKGESLEKIESEMIDIAEGVKSTKIVYEQSLKHNIDMPITFAIYKVIYDKNPIKETIFSLMTRELKKEK